MIGASCTNNTYNVGRESWHAEPVTIARQLNYFNFLYRQSQERPQSILVSFIYYHQDCGKDAGL